MKRNIICLILLLCSVLFARNRNYYPFEEGGRIGINMPGEDIYKNTTSLNAFARYNLESQFSISLNLTVADLIVKPDDSSYTDDHLTLLFVELTRLKFSGEKMITSATLGLGKMFLDGNDELGFVMGLGIKYPLAKCVYLDFSIKDHMTELSVPFVSFPDFQVAAAGGGIRYLQVSIGLSFGLGQKKTMKMSNKSCDWWKF